MSHSTPREAASPATGGRAPIAGWADLLRRILRRLHDDRISLVSAGCAFYSTLALFPALSMLLSLYGLLSHPATIEPQLQLLRDVLPGDAAGLIGQRVHVLVSHRSGALGLSLGIGAFFTVWGTLTGTQAMLTALNVAYDEAERRGLVRVHLTGFGITLAALLAATAGLTVLVALSHAAIILGLPRSARMTVVHQMSIVIVVLLVGVATAALYRYGPSRHPGRERRVLPGTLLTTALWLAASFLFSVYVTHLANFDATYGPLGAIAGIMLWFWVMAYVLLLGAELNSALEHRRGAPIDAQEQATC